MLTQWCKVTIIIVHFTFPADGHHTICTARMKCRIPEKKKKRSAALPVCDWLTLACRSFVSGLKTANSLTGWSYDQLSCCGAGKRVLYHHNHWKIRQFEGWWFDALMSLETTGNVNVIARQAITEFLHLFIWSILSSFFFLSGHTEVITTLSRECNSESCCKASCSNPNAVIWPFKSGNFPTVSQSQQELHHGFLQRAKTDSSGRKKSPEKQKYNKWQKIKAASWLFSFSFFEGILLKIIIGSLWSIIYQSFKSVLIWTRNKTNMFNVVPCPPDWCLQTLLFKFDRSCNASNTRT